MPRKIILDCDPGHDDAMAILLAAGCPEIDLLAITTVAGNQTLEKTTLNARRMCTIAGVAVPIAAGCDRPLVRELVVAPHIHGESGLDGPSFSTPTAPLLEVHAVDLIIDLVMQSDGDITLVPTGPLTNIAMALRREPRIATRIREVVFMGGAYTRGNTTPAAEFNMYVDPEAAGIVFDAAMPLVMVGLDLTHQALVSPQVIERISAIDSPLTRIAVELMAFYTMTNQREGRLPAPPLHDPCAVANADLLGLKDAFIAIETAGRWTAGMTVVDFSGTLGQKTNASVATTLDADGFWDLMIDALIRLGPST